LNIIFKSLSNSFRHEQKHRHEHDNVDIIADVEEK